MSKIEMRGSRVIVHREYRVTPKPRENFRDDGYEDSTGNYGYTEEMERFLGEEFMVKLDFTYSSSCPGYRMTSIARHYIWDEKWLTFISPDKPYSFGDSDCIYEDD